MAVLSGQTIRRREIFRPFVERSKHLPTNTSYGLSMCGYDVRLDQDVAVYPGFTRLASTYEEFTMPDDVVAIVHDKSTWARLGQQVQNTVAEPGWRGYLTIELTYAPVLPVNASRWEIFWRRLLLASGFYPPLVLEKGTPIAQILCHSTDEPTVGYGDGKYQNQKRGPQEAITT